MHKDTDRRIEERIQKNIMNIRHITLGIDIENLNSIIPFVLLSSWYLVNLKVHDAFLMASFCHCEEFDGIKNLQNVSYFQLRSTFYV